MCRKKERKFESDFLTVTCCQRSPTFEVSREAHLVFAEIFLQNSRKKVSPPPCNIFVCVHAGNSFFDVTNSCRSFCPSPPYARRRKEKQHGVEAIIISDMQKNLLPRHTHTSISPTLHSPYPSRLRRRRRHKKCRVVNSLGQQRQRERPHPPHPLLRRRLPNAHTSKGTNLPQRKT